MTLHLGNDIVDLTDPFTVGKSGDARFVRRVFATSEQGWIAASPDPDRALWRLWAAKEAAYKAARKSAPDLVFAHAQFEVHPAEFRVVCGKASFPVQWDEQPGWIHCLAATSAAAAFLAQSRWQVDELALGQKPSAAVRGLATRLLAEAGVTAATIVRPSGQGGARSGAPEVWRAGSRLAHLDLTLSHDGRWVAVAWMDLNNLAISQDVRVD
ncbi:MAG: 4'-phosphopantetheinyl transferase superfamily protein [Myxococcota bacterium]